VTAPLDRPIERSVQPFVFGGGISMFRKLVVVVALCSMASPVFGQTLRESAQAAARTESVQSRSSDLGPMPKGLFWTGVGLLGAGGLTLLMGAAIKNGDCDLEFDESDCDDIGTGFYVLGGAMAGTGAALMFVANAKRERLPSITFTRHGGVAVRHRITF
jgi:hypothetical protein